MAEPQNRPISTISRFVSFTSAAHQIADVVKSMQRPLMAGMVDVEC